MDQRRHGRGVWESSEALKEYEAETRKLYQRAVPQKRDNSVNDDIFSPSVSSVKGVTRA